MYETFFVQTPTYGVAVFVNGEVISREFIIGSHNKKIHWI